ncbi:MAG: SDR family oxidoreductase [Burkholderiaceae bacterium]|nr:SDR family oxidoreductase [Burkholderiaceae bacterium]
MKERLAGRVAVVTGGAAGIGKEFSIALASQGAKVLVADIQDAAPTLERIEAAGGTGIGMKVDVANEKDVGNMVERTLDAYGRLDILINNAGVYPMQSFEQIGLDDWQKVLRVNLDGTFLCIKAALPQMKAQRYGRIVTITSTTFFMGVPHFAHYVSTKGGVIGLTRSLAAEVGEFGITMNCIAPGLTKTEGLEATPQLLQAWDMLVASQCIKRKQTPADLVGPLLFFASDDSAFVTGQTLCVDGGWARH